MNEERELSRHLKVGRILNMRCTLSYCLQTKMPGIFVQNIRLALAVQNKSAKKYHININQTEIFIVYMLFVATNKKNSAERLIHKSRV